MKNFNLFAAAALTVLTAGTVLAQNPHQFVKVTMTSNSNNLNQQPATMVVMFGPGENDSLQFPDAGNQGTLGQIGDNCYPFSVTSDDFIVTNLDARGELNRYTSVPFGFVNKDSCEIKVIASVSNSNGDTVNNLPAYVWLEQISTGEKFSILGDTAKFTLAANLGFATDFILHTGPANIISATEESCYNVADASILFKTPNYTGATFELNNSGGPVASGVISGNDTTITNLAAGNYVAVIRINNVTVDSSDVTINPQNPLIADFIADYNSIIIGNIVTFTDNSVGGLTYTWDFGDGNSDTLAGTVSHTYLATGYFNASLTISDTNGCTSSVSDVIEVNYSTIQNPNTAQGHGQGQGRAQEVPEINSTESGISVSANEMIQITITSANGALVYTGSQNGSRADYAVPANGIYIVTVTDQSGNKTVKTVASF